MDPLDKLVQTADEQCQVLLRLGVREPPLPVRLKVGQAPPHPIDAGLELVALDQPLGIAVDEPPDAAAQSGDPALEVGVLRLAGVLARLIEPVWYSAATRPGSSRRVRISSHTACSKRSLRTDLLSQTACPAKRCASVPVQR